MAKRMVIYLGYLSFGIDRSYNMVYPFLKCIQASYMSIKSNNNLSATGLSYTTRDF